MRTRLLTIALLLIGTLTAADYKGKVQFGGLPIPGVTVTATQDTGTTGAPAIIARRSKPLGVAASSPKNGTQIASERLAF